MPPMSSLNTFINALITGKTRTTEAAQRAIGRGHRSPALVSLVRKPNAFKKPLQKPLRDALKAANLPEDFIIKCIDGWPDAQKEKARVAIVGAIRNEQRVRVRWGLATGPGYETQVQKTESTVTITARSPRARLRARRNEVFVH